MVFGDIMLKSNLHLIHCALNRVGEHSGTPPLPCSTTMKILAQGGALHIMILSEGVVSGSRGKMRREGVLDEGMNLEGRYGGGDTLHPQPCVRAHCCATPASGTPSFPPAVTMITLARGGALHQTMLSEGVVGGI